MPVVVAARKVHCFVSADLFQSVSVVEKTFEVLKNHRVKVDQKKKELVTGQQKHRGLPGPFL